MSEALTIGAAWRRACDRIDRKEARLLLEKTCGATHADLISRPERGLDAAQTAAFDALLARRVAGEPLAYLLGSVWFDGLEFFVSPAVLIPRPDTEVLVECAAAYAARLKRPKIVDLGTGSGVVAITLARRVPGAGVCAVDLSAEALDVARANAARHGVTIDWRQGDWFSPLSGERFDVIVSNPPYVAAGDPHLLADGLPFEPQLALTDGVAGGDGMACIERLVAGAAAHIHPGGMVLIEHGFDQAVKVRACLEAAGWASVRSWRDAGGIERVSGGTWR